MESDSLNTTKENREYEKVLESLSFVANRLEDKLRPISIPDAPEKGVGAEPVYNPKTELQLSLESILERFTDITSRIQL